MPALLLLYVCFTGALLAAFWTLVVVQWGTAKLSAAATPTGDGSRRLPPRAARAG